MSLTGFRKETLENDVLNELKPCNGNLKQLEIVSYGGIEFPNWIGDPSFVHLKHVSIRGCEKCISLPPLGQLPSLKELFIKGLDGVKFVGSDLLGSGVAFRSLEILSFEDMKGWEEWSTNSGDVFPCLEELSIEDCPNLKVISVEALPRVKVLKVIRCDNGALRSLVDIASSVRNLVIESISGLTDEVWGGVMEYLGGVEELIIRECNEIRYLWESEEKASKDLVNLRNLEVRHCEKLLRLGEKKDNGMMMTSIRKLEISYCKSMECCSCPNSIESLTINSCDSLTGMSFPKGGGEKLKSLWIEGCDKLLETEFGGGEKNRSSSVQLINNISMPMLEDIWINGWVNLKSIIELNCYLHLTSLRIDDCSSLESFPDHQLSNLTSLTHLAISDCPSMDASFPSSGVVWPPKLQSLVIGRLKKPMSEWGTQNYPTSLTRLYLWGGSSDEDVNDISKLSHLLPSSLTTLQICFLENLETLSEGLQHLTSLQHLDIYDCPKLKDLPEMLLPSLLSLEIYYCPKLKKRCKSKTGRGYWPLISHIPKIDIDIV